MEKTQIKVDDIFGDVINKDNDSQDQIVKLNNFSGKLM